MLADLCELLAASGHEVHVLCSRGAYDDGSTSPRPMPKSELHRGVRIHRIRATGFGKKSVVGQAIDFISFHTLTGFRTMLAAFKFDVIVTLTTPPLINVYGLIAQKLARIKHIAWVMDLHPDVEWELGVFGRKKLLPRIADELNALAFSRADACVVLGPYMRARLAAKGVADHLIHDIPVWGHDLPADEISSNSLRTELGLEGKFVVMYSGNAGLVHTFDEVCAAALQLRDDSRIVFLFIGGGRRLSEIRAFRQTHGLTNIVDHGYLPRHRLRESLTLADVHLVTLRPTLAGVSVPCKLYGIMAAARPAIFVGPPHSETADAIRTSGCGTIIPNGDAGALVAAIRKLAADRTLVSTQGKAARQAYEQTFNARACGQRWIDLLARLSGRTNPQTVSFEPAVSDMKVSG